MKINLSSAALLLVLASMYLLLAFKKKDEPKAVSFEGTYTTTREVLSPPPTLKQRVTGTSQTKPLGINKFVALSTVNVTPPPPFKLTGDATFSAENGDSFTTTFTGTNTPNAEGIAIVEMMHTITGGTGQFAKATGTFVGNATADPKTQTGSITYKGTITY